MAAETERGLRDIAVNTARLPDPVPAAALRIITRRRKRPAPPGVGPVAKARFRQRGGRKPDAYLDY